MTELATSEVLYRAADLIEERGWATGNCGMKAAPTAPMCLEGAISAAMGIQPVASLGVTRDLPAGTMIYPYGYALEKSAAYAAVLGHLEIGDDLWAWNDRNGNDAAAVIATLRACAVIEAARETPDIWPHVGADRMPEAMS